MSSRRHCSQTRALWIRISSYQVTKMKEANITGESKNLNIFQSWCSEISCHKLIALKKKSRWIFFTLAYYYRFVKYWSPLPLTEKWILQRHFTMISFTKMIQISDTFFFWSIEHLLYILILHRNIGCFTSEIQRKLILAIVCKIILRRDSHYMACNIFDYM